MLNSRLALAEDAWSRAVEHAQRAGNHREALEGLAWVAAAVWVGPTPADEGIRRCRAIFDQAQGDRRPCRPRCSARPVSRRTLGHFGQATELFQRARALLEEVALPVWLAGGLTQALGWALLFEGKPAVAERELRRGYESLTASAR
jgi:hypothetical protein